MNWVSIGAITNPFPNFNSATIEVWKWISNFIPHFAGHVITYYCDYLIKGVTGQNIIFNKPILPKITYLKAFHAEVFWRNIKIYLHHTPMLSLHRLSKSFHISDKDQFFLHIPCHASWWSGDECMAPGYQVYNWSGGGVTKPIFSVPLFSEFFNIIQTHVIYWRSRLYLTGVAAAQLRWHLSNINVIQTI